MTDDSAVRTWARVHSNGMVAFVWSTDDPQRFVAGAAPNGGSNSVGRVTGSLQDAQRAADREAKCPQCKCPPWG